MQYDPALLNALEPAQLKVAKEKPLPRRVLGRGTLVLLIALRVYIFLAVPVVVYAFVRALIE